MLILSLDFEAKFDSKELQNQQKLVATTVSYLG